MVPGHGSRISLCFPCHARSLFYVAHCSGSTHHNVPSQTLFGEVRILKTNFELLQHDGGPPSCFRMRPTIRTHSKTRMTYCNALAKPTFPSYTRASSTPCPHPTPIALHGETRVMVVNLANASPAPAIKGRTVCDHQRLEANYHIGTQGPLPRNASMS